MRKYLLLTCGFLAVALYSLSQNVISDSHAATRKVGSFHAIHVASGIDLYLSQGSEAVAVSASDPSYRDRIVTEVEDGVLQIYMDHKWQLDGWGNHHLKAYVSFSSLDVLKASGGSDVYSQGTFTLNKLEITLTGGSDLKNAKVAVTDLSLHQSGGSDSQIGGTATNLKVDLSGGSDMHGYDLVTEHCDVSSSGGSDTQITVNKELNVSASGGSDVYYKGAAVIRELRSSGSSSISKKG